MVCLCLLEMSLSASPASEIRETEAMGGMGDTWQVQRLTGRAKPLTFQAPALPLSPAAPALPALGEAALAADCPPHVPLLTGARGETSCVDYSPLTLDIESRG